MPRPVLRSPACSDVSELGASAGAVGDHRRAELLGDPHDRRGEELDPLAVAVGVRAAASAIASPSRERFGVDPRADRLPRCRSRARSTRSPRRAGRASGRRRRATRSTAPKHRCPVGEQTDRTGVRVEDSADELGRRSWPVATAASAICTACRGTIRSLPSVERVGRERRASRTSRASSVRPCSAAMVATPVSSATAKCGWRSAVVRSVRFELGVSALLAAQAEHLRAVRGPCRRLVGCEVALERVVHELLGVVEPALDEREHRAVPRELDVEGVVARVVRRGARTRRSRRRPRRGHRTRGGRPCGSGGRSARAYGDAVAAAATVTSSSSSARRRSRLSGVQPRAARTRARR